MATCDTRGDEAMARMLQRQYDSSGIAHVEPIPGVPVASAEPVAASQPISDGTPIAVAQVTSTQAPNNVSNGGRIIRVHEPSFVLVDFPAHPPNAPPGGVWVEVRPLPSFSYSHADARGVLSMFHS